MLNVPAKTEKKSYSEPRGAVVSPARGPSVPLD